MEVACEIKEELSKLDEDVKDVLRVSEVATGAEVSGVSHVTEGNDISGAFQVATGGNAVAEGVCIEIVSGATNGGTTGVYRAVRAAGSGVSRCYDGVNNPSVVPIFEDGGQEGSTKGGDGNVPPVSLHTIIFSIYCTNDTLHLFHVPLLSNNINTGWHIPSLLPILPITPRH